MRPFSLPLKSLFILALLGAAPSQAQAQAQATAIDVNAVTVNQDQISEPVFASGSMAPTRVTNLSPRADGVIDKIYVKVGDTVKKGDPLFRTRQINYEIAEEELTHRLSLAEAELKNAKQELARSQELSAKGVITNARLDQQTTMVSTAQARVGIARTQLQRAQQNLSDTIVRSPYDAVVTERNVDEGAFMRTMSMSGGFGGMGGRGTGGVVAVQEIKIAVAIVNAPETQLQKLAVGLPAKVTIDGIGKTYDTKISVLNHLVNVQDRTVELRMTVPNSDYAIKPGLFATAQIFPEAQNVLTLPRATLLGSSSNRYVMVIKGNTVERRPVTTRDIDTTRVEILSGLRAGEQVAAGNNLPLLQNGNAITVSGSAN